MTVSVNDLHKRYGGAVALDGVSLELLPGEVHALLGPNGAGKSTLIKCLSGAAEPDRGTITIGEATFSSFSSAEALRCGVAVIYQHLSLIDELTVADNVYLGSEVTRLGLVDQRRQRAAATALLREFFVDLEIDVDARVGDLPLAAKQLVEIGKALHRGTVELLILDEPTAALTEVESAVLATRLRELKEQNIHILYTSHILREVFEIADRVSVMRDGKLVLCGRSVAETSAAEVIELISGRAAPTNDVRAAGYGVTVVEALGLHGDGFGPVTLQAREGEIVGLFGLLGCGKSEVLETVYGIRTAREGTLRIDGREGQPPGPRQALERGVALVPGERLRQALFPPLSSLDNLLLPSVRRLATRGLRRCSRERALFERTAEALHLSPLDPDVRAGELSGGNQQKLVVARWLSGTRRLRVLLLDEPTQGIDVGARRELYEVLRRTVADGSRTILFSSSDPEEVVALADRAIVLDRGEVTCELSGSELSEERLLFEAHRAEARAA